MADYMKEAERLAQAYADAVLLGDGNDEALAALLAHIQRGAASEGWKEATIAWEVCASIHREYAKKKDPFFTTRQADFVRHTEAARAALLAAAPAPDHFRDAAGTAAKPAEPERRIGPSSDADMAVYQSIADGYTRDTAPTPAEVPEPEPADVKLYAWRPSGHGEYSFYVASTSEEAAREAVQAEVDDLRKIGLGYETHGWEADYYTLECVGLNEVMTNDND